MNIIITLALLCLASPSLAWDNGNDSNGSIFKQPGQQERSSWDRQQETYVRQGYDTYQYGPAVRHEEEMRHRRSQGTDQALTNLERYNREALSEHRSLQEQQQQQRPGHRR